MATEVVFIADQMFPMPALPDPAFAFGNAAVAALFAVRNLPQNQVLIRRQPGWGLINAAFFHDG